MKNIKLNINNEIEILKTRINDLHTLRDYENEINTRYRQIEMGEISKNDLEIVKKDLEKYKRLFNDLVKELNDETDVAYLCGYDEDSVQFISTNEGCAIDWCNRNIGNNWYREIERRDSYNYIAYPTYRTDIDDSKKFNS